MNSIEINVLLSNLSTFQGVYALDTLPNVLTGDIVFNHQSSNLMGSHWSCIRVRENTVQYFDPLALPIPDIITQYITNQIRDLSFLQYKQRVQSYSSDACGHHCIYFLLNNKPATNDNEAKSFIKTLYSSKKH